MTVEFTDLGVITQILTEYVFGNTLVLSIAIFLAFLAYMTMSGVPLTVSIATLLPLLASFQLAGWLGDAQYVLSLAIIVIGIVISNILIRLYARA